MHLVTAYLEDMENPASPEKRPLSAKNANQKGTWNLHTFEFLACREKVSMRFTPLMKSYLVEKVLQVACCMVNCIRNEQTLSSFNFFFIVQVGEFIFGMAFVHVLAPPFSDKNFHKN